MQGVIDSTMLQEKLVELKLVALVKLMLWNW
jgi:hypothetical protein